MENKPGAWTKIAGFIADAASIMRGKAAVQQIVEMRLERAKFRIDSLVEEIVLYQNQALMAAILDEFGNQLQAAETRDFQNEVNDLLWYFKDRFMLASGNTSRQISG